MKNLLTALQEGRLIELPVEDKDQVLEYLALIIEAIPDIGTNSDLVKDALEREKQANTGIGMGIACPHIRSKNEGNLFCAVGWSPEGVEYGATDGKKVHLIVMYFIPDSQRSAYLKEISGLAKAVHDTGGLEAIEGLKDIQSVRDRLLDWVEMSLEKAVPVSKARMIKLEARKAEFEAVPAAEADKVPSRMNMVPFAFVVAGDGKNLVLSKDQAFAEKAETDPELAKLLVENAEIEWNGYQILVTATRHFSMNRVLNEGVAVKLHPIAPAPKPANGDVAQLPLGYQPPPTPPTPPTA